MIIASALLAAATMGSNLDSLYSADFERFNCPAGRLDISNLAWVTNLGGSGAVDPNQDVTQFQSIWGRTSANDPIVPFPGKNHFTTMVMNREYFLAAGFTVPAGISTTTTGGFTHGSTNPGPPMDMAISAECGNFAPAEQFCSKSNVTTGNSMVQWKIGASASAHCGLAPGQTYYVNVRLTNPDVVDPLDCGAPGTAYYHLCTATIVNNVTP